MVSVIYLYKQLKSFGGFGKKSKDAKKTTETSSGGQMWIG